MWGQANCDILGGLHKVVKKPLFTEGAVDGRLQHVLLANCNSVTGHLQHHQKTEKSRFGGCLCGGRKVMIF
jgi:hypothetical protein